MSPVVPQTRNETLYYSVRTASCKDIGACRANLTLQPCSALDMLHYTLYTCLLVAKANCKQLLSLWVGWMLHTPTNALVPLQVGGLRVLTAACCAA